MSQKGGVWAESPNEQPSVILLSSSPHTFDSLYLSYRVSASRLTPYAMRERIRSEKVTDADKHAFIERRMRVGHTSPLEQVWWQFAISGVSRVFSHQFVRHRVGISFEQQSQRYVKMEEDFDYRVPPTVKDANMDGNMARAMARIGELYEDMVEAGVPPEDARFVLPAASTTNLVVTINFAAMLHIADIRLCTRAQWEFRKVVALMRAEIKKDAPQLAKYLQPKCGELRMGYCDEEYKDWEACPIGRVRPHKDDLFRIYEGLKDRDFEVR